MASGEWLYSTLHTSPCRVIEENELWGNVTCTVILPDQNRIAVVPRSSLRPLDERLPKPSSHYIRYIALATKIADILEGNPDSEGRRTLLAPIGSHVIPLPHQLTALQRAVADERIRYLLADEVGLGKTIEAGLILRELKLRGIIRRILIVVPKGLTEQWVSEMKTHFNEEFSILLPDDIQTLRKIAPSIENRLSGGKSHHIFQKETNPWTIFHQVIVPIDSVKPLDRRKGWSDEKIRQYNKDRYEDLITAGWDLIIVDEAHRLGGSTDLIARYKLGRGLADASPYLLLLSATPHQGKTESFFRLISLLDQKMFPDQESITRDTVRNYVIRTVKRLAIDSDGNPLFKPRETHLYPVRWSERHPEQQELYDAVTDYVKAGYNTAMQEKKPYLGFLMVLMQRLVSSSTAAIERTLERRLRVLQGDAPHPMKSFNRYNQEETPLSEELYDLTGDDLLEIVIDSEERGAGDEADAVVGLLKMARDCRQKSPDAKAEELVEIIYRLRTEEQDPNLKILIFTEFIPTQEMLSMFLTDRGFSVAQLNGRMSLEERNLAQEKFLHQAQFLISTDAGGEGLNLQFCHVVINYDLPWNPMRLEQRIGRVDRIGQNLPVRAFNLAFENSVEFRVREVLEEKLAIIYREFGVDKTGDVLDSAIAGEIFEDVFIESIQHPESIDSSVSRAVMKIEREIEDLRRHSILSGISDTPEIEISKKVQDHPFSYWLEMMTISYLLAHNGVAKHRIDSWDLTWPDGTEYTNAVFTDQKRTPHPGQYVLSPEDGHISEIITAIPEYIPARQMAAMYIQDLPVGLAGYWGLFEISFTFEAPAENEEALRYIPSKKKTFFPIFLSDEAVGYRQTAYFIWDCVMSNYYSTQEYADRRSSEKIFEKMMNEARVQGEAAFTKLQEEHQEQIRLETLRAERSFSAKRRAIEKIGLPEVRNFRLRELQKEEDIWKEQIQSAEYIIPNLKPFIILRVEQRRDSNGVA